MAMSLIPEAVPSDAAEFMDLRHLHDLAALEDQYWWHVAKRRLVHSLLTRYFPPPGRLVEGGVGGCGNLRAFQAAGYDVCGLDILPQAIEHGRHRGLENLYCHDLLQDWPQQVGPADVVVLLDVLEHVADPALLLRNARERLKPSGGIIVTVPAYPWLYGPWDQQLGHYRRYTPRRLRADAAAAGYRLAWLSYWNLFSVPPAVLVRFWQKRRRSGSVEFPRVSPLINRCLVAMANAERCWLRCARLPAGLSLVGVLVR